MSGREAPGTEGSTYARGIGAVDSRPRITVVTPSFNQAPFLEETLRSIVSQREHVHEFIVMDGGSTDRSVDIIRKYDSAIDWWVSQHDDGQSAALNQAFSRASGDYLLWINSDDVLLPGALERVRNALAANPACDVMSAWFVQVDVMSRIIGAVRMPVEKARRMRHAIIRIAQPTCVFRRELFERLGGFREELHCVFDTELWMRFAQAGARFGITPAYNAAFRIHPRSKGGSWRERYRQEGRMLDRIHPKMRWRGLMHYVVRYGYKALQYLTLRGFIARRDAQRWRGKTVAEVFGNGDDLLMKGGEELVIGDAVMV